MIKLDEDSLLCNLDGNKDLCFQIGDSNTGDFFFTSVLTRLLLKGNEFLLLEKLEIFLINKPMVELLLNPVVLFYNYSLSFTPLNLGFIIHLFKLEELNSFEV